MAITRDASSSNGTHVCTGSNLILIVSVISHGNVALATPTYNGVAMTLISSQGYSGGVVFISVYYLANPSTGSHTIGYTGSADSVTILGASYTGYGGGIDASNGNNGTAATSLTGSVTTIKDNCWVILCAGNNGTVACAASTGANLVVSHSDSGDASGGIFDNNGPKTPAGSISESVTFASATWGYVILSIKPVVPQTLTDSISSTEKLLNGKIFKEAITLITVYLQTFTDIITSTEIFANLKKRFRNITKNISTWTENDTKH